MTRNRTLLFLVPVVPVLLVVIVVLYLNFADLGGWRDSVADLVSKNLGREMVINGIFEPEIGLTTSVAAGNITLENADWGSQATMLSIDHLNLEINLLSLLFRPIRIESLELDGVQVLIETDVEGATNWNFETAEEDERDSNPLKLALGTIDLTDVEVISRGAVLSEEITLGATRLSIRGNETGMVDLALEGHLNQTGFSMAGRLGPLAGLLQGKAVQFDLTADLGVIDFSSKGQIADLKTLGGADFRAEAHGADLATFGEIFDLENLEKGPFRLALDVRPETAGASFEMDISAGGIGAEIAGTVDSLIAPGMLDLMVQASGPDVATLGILTGIEGLPAEGFTVSGHVRWEGFPLSCDNVEVRVGDNSISANGVLGEPPLMMGTDFTFSGGGPDISPLAALAGVNLPKDSFSFGGRLIRQEQSIAFEKIEIVVGRNTLEIDGIVGDPPEYAGTTLTISGQGPNLAHFQGLAGIELPAEQFEFDGKLVQGEGAITLEAVRARLGRTTLRANGQLSTENGFAGTDLRLYAQGPDASKPAILAQMTSVPAEPWTAEGRIKVLTSGFLLDGFVGTLDDIDFEADGRIILIPDFIDSQLQFTIRGPRLSALLALINQPGLPELSAESFSLSGQVVVEESGYLVENIEATLADATVQLAGRIGLQPSFGGTDLTINSDGPSALLFTALTGVTAPVAPFRFAGRVERLDSALYFHSFQAQLGRHRIDIDGILGDPPKLIGTKLEINAEGPSLTLFHELFGLEQLPDQPYMLEGLFDGTTERFSARSLNLRVGPSELEGSFIVDITGKPEVQAELKSRRLDLSVFLERLKAESRPSDEAMELPAAPRSGFLISDEKIDLEFLRKADAEVTIHVKELILPVTLFHDVDIDLQLENGRLEIKRLTATDQAKGRVAGNLILEPDGEQFRLRTQLKISQIRPDLSGSTIDLAMQPPIDIDVDLEALGATLHDFAGSANGRLQFVMGQGELDNSSIDLLATDLLVETLAALNPFSAKDKATRLQCAVLGVTMKGGVARVEPLAIQTDKVTILGKGRIDLATESLDLEWVSKPRKGIGLSASMITNPYLKLGGTLLEPSLEFKEFQAVASTGVAVATLGLSLVAKGMLDRVTADRDVCQDALTAIDAQSAGTPEPGGAGTKK